MSFEPRPGTVITPDRLARLVDDHVTAGYLRRYVAMGTAIRLLAPPGGGRDKMFVATYADTFGNYNVVTYGEIRGFPSEPKYRDRLPTRRPYITQMASATRSYVFGLTPRRFARARIDADGQTVGRATIRRRGFFIRVPLTATTLRIVLTPTHGEPFDRTLDLTG